MSTPVMNRRSEDRAAADRSAPGGLSEGSGASQTKARTAAPSEAELIEIENDVDHLDGKVRTVTDQQRQWNSVSIKLDSAQRLVETARRLIELARARGAS